MTLPTFSNQDTAQPAENCGNLHAKNSNTHTTARTTSGTRGTTIDWTKWTRVMPADAQPFTHNSDTCIILVYSAQFNCGGFVIVINHVVAYGVASKSTECQNVLFTF